MNKTLTSLALATAVIGGVAVYKNLPTDSQPVTPVVTVNANANVEARQAAFTPDANVYTISQVKGVTKACKSVGGLPDPVCNPGAIRTTDLQSICHGGSTKQFRPTSEYTTALKKIQMVWYGMTGLLTKDVEEDHLISLELGGHPTSPLNLWPEPWKGDYNAHIKDFVENRTHKLVCAGKMDIVEAQDRIASDWVSLGKSEGVIQ